MPWNWQGRGDLSTAQGGHRGSYEEAKVAHAWPKYESEYLKQRLSNPQGKYAQGPSGGKITKEVKDFIYYDKISEDYKQEADECLKAEFNQWLAGQHQDNLAKLPYKNDAGKPQRLAVFREKDEVPGQPLKADWYPTWWGRRQLTHLPGVRDYLRDQKRLATEADLRMNLLAETGPQNLEQAWVYFKHWVKGRPVGPEICMTKRLGIPGEFGDGSMMPYGMKGWREGIEGRNAKKGIEERNTKYMLKPILTPRVSKPHKMEFDVTSPDPASSASDELLTRDPFLTPYRPYSPPGTLQTESWPTSDSPYVPLLNETTSDSPYVPLLNETDPASSASDSPYVKPLINETARNFTEITEENILETRLRKPTDMYNASA